MQSVKQSQVSLSSKTNPTRPYRKILLSLKGLRAADGAAYWSSDEKLSQHSTFVPTVSPAAVRMRNSATSWLMLSMSLSKCGQAILPFLVAETADREPRVQAKAIIWVSGCDQIQVKAYAVALFGVTSILFSDVNRAYHKKRVTWANPLIVVRVRKGVETYQDQILGHFPDLKAIEHHTLVED
ncbi:hypothetical protein VTK73DRAFT_116 [Phialemonium thermophilum]|uniref:Uncharacterized protein n=1 Tax=Phialemonium thermophilum TaxID=223376 RepID=A0ABR3Y411_9PEZI